MSKLKILFKALWHFDFSVLKSKNIITEIRKYWGQPAPKKRKFDQIRIYHDLIKDKVPDTLVDSRTWQDLNMDKIFAKIDHNLSTIGTQYLYHRLHKYNSDKDQLSQNNKHYQLFSENSHLREKIQRQLYKLRHDNASYIPRLIFQKLPTRPKYYFLLYILSSAMIVSLILIFFRPVFLFVAGGLAIINPLINYFYGQKITGYIVDISYLSTMLKAGINLATIEQDLPQLKQLKKLKNFALSLNKKVGWLLINTARLNEIAALVIEYLNYFCLFNVIAFIHSIKYIRANQTKLGQIYSAIGALDTELSVASYTHSIPYFCQPIFYKNKSIDVKNIYHPLLSDPVPNDFKLGDKSVLITGSNMAGKTTFMKTIGVNLILGQSIGICLAQSARLPQLIIKSSIQRSDDIDDNKSYYLKEIEAVHRFLKLSAKSDRYLFLIDEIFRGTNTVERIAAATSVLKQLAQNTLVFVTTHDVELQELLINNYKMFHFSEEVQAGQHYFDYKLKSGPTSSRNAIKLLEIKGYPKQVIAEARKLAQKFERSNNLLETLLD